MTVYNFKHSRLFSLKTAKKIILGLVIVFVFDFFFFPAPVFASEEIVTDQSVFIISEETSITPEPVFIGNLPVNSDLEVVKSGYITATAYTSEVSQCYGAPCLIANGFNLCEHGIEDSIAANFLPFGTKVRLPDHFGDRIFIVRDRMNAKYDYRIDIWMVDKVDARKFGVKSVRFEVLK